MKTTAIETLTNVAGALTKKVDHAIQSLVNVTKASVNYKPDADTNYEPKSKVPVDHGITNDPATIIKPKTNVIRKPEAKVVPIPVSEETAASVKKSTSMIRLINRLCKQWGEVDNPTPTTLLIQDEAGFHITVDGGSFEALQKADLRLACKVRYNMPKCVSTTMLFNDDGEIRYHMISLMYDDISKLKPYRQK